MTSPFNLAVLAPALLPAAVFVSLLASPELAAEGEPADKAEVVASPDSEAGSSDSDQVPPVKTGKPKRPPIAAEAERPKGRPTLTSGLRVPAGETFHLGERQTGDFTVSARNDGKEAVVILATRGERREVVGVVKPKEVVVRGFKTGDGVLVQNPSEKSRARLYVEVWGTRNLAMYYRPNDEEPPTPEPAEASPAKPAAQADPKPE